MRMGLVSNVLTAAAYRNPLYHNELQVSVGARYIFDVTLPRCRAAPHHQATLQK